MSMSRVKNVSGGPLDVPLLNRTVQADEVVDVPDFQPAHTDDEPLPIIWPANRWQPVDVSLVGEHGPEIVSLPAGSEVAEGSAE
jgi:hypothetical protein